MATSSIDERWAKEIDELADLVSRCGGRFQFGARPDGVLVRLICRSPLRVEGGEPEIREVEHELLIVRPSNWPASPPHVLHRSPRTLVHGNVLYPEPGERTPLFAPRGLVCWTHRWSPSIRLTNVVLAIYDILTYRMGRFATDASDCLSRSSVVWANEALARDPDVFPTDERPLIVSGNGADDGAMVEETVKGAPA